MARQSRAEVVLVPWRFCHNTQLPPPPELSIPRRRAWEAEPEEASSRRGGGTNALDRREGNLTWNVSQCHWNLNPKYLGRSFRYLARR